ncbi:MAG: hypothetical protein BWY63_03871 [Chloroflexi bacterium ADurb.Bin360]|nr:MAG: hypothetical protein BWY63_03871 [Chloroflexi bacterium ADurb.Bin360]
MYPLPVRCPVCDGELAVERLVCRNCNTAIQGEFALQRLLRLTPEQWAFVEVFLRCEGKFTRVQEEMDLSYPTVRSRMNDVIRALGYEVGAATEEDVEDRQSVLDALAAGHINVTEAIRQLKQRRVG